jgi:hypothetical protein
MLARSAVSVRAGLGDVLRKFRPSTAGVLAAVLSSGLIAAPVTVRAESVTATRVTTYVPVLPHTARLTGHCWTRSIAAPARADAYRCMAGDSIYDPCFAPPRAHAVVCDVNPTTRNPGFAMRLTQPLPNEPVFASSVAMPWLVQLTDGEVCVPLTGTHEAMGRETIGYECSEARSLMNAATATGLVDGSITTGTVWHARKAVYRVSRGGRVTGSIARVPLAAVWR